MSIQAPQGILNIPNAILRVGKLAVDEVVGADTILNTVARNTILLVDVEAYHENKNWSLKLPNAWAGEFECNTASAGNYSEFNFYNEGASSNVQGYNLTFNDTAVELRYDGTLLKTGTLASTITGTGVKKVRLMFERTILSVTVDGTLVFTHDDTIGPRPRVYSTTAGGFLNFFTDGGALKNLKIVNEKWMSDGTSNIAYVGGGEVAVGQALAFNRVSNVSQIKVDSNVVTEYTGPHDRPLRKYPEVAMTSASQGGYVVDKSEESSSGDAYAAYRAFDGIIPDGTTTIGWRTDSGYNQDTGLADGGVTRFTGDSGEWVELQLPNSIKLSSIVLKVGNQGNNLANSQRRFPKVFVIYGYNGTSWDRIQEYTTSAIQSLTDVQTFHISNPTAYHNKFVLVVKQTYSVTGATSGVTNIGELEYYGHEEGSGSLDTTLKSVYNVPATTGTQLEVYYDAKDLTTMPSIVTNLAGGDQNGAVTGVTLDTTGGIESFLFDSSNEYISGTLPSTATGNWVHTISTWVNLPQIPTGGNYLFNAGIQPSSSSPGESLVIYIRQAGVYFDVGYESYRVDTLTPGQWSHISAVYTGGTLTSGVSIYINGVLKSQTDTSGSTQLNLTTQDFKIGASANGGSQFNGSIANFRLYSKALNADQIKELYDYQKDYFLGSKSQVTLYKGHLGVGVTEPSGQLELAGDERIQEYPPGPMSDYDTNIPGHGVFKAYASNENTNVVWEAFDKSNNNGRHYQHSTSSGGGYSTSDGSYGGSVRLSSSSGTPLGVHVILKMPYQIYLKQFSIQPRNNAGYLSEQTPKDGQVWGSNDGNSWYHLYSYTGLTFTSGTDTVYFNVNHTNAYSYYALIVTKSGGGTNSFEGFSIGELRYFGTPGPTTLDKGSLSLTRSLDVPRVSRYDVDTETPRPEKLVLDLDTTVNNHASDISGQGNHGTFNNGASYSPADKAFTGFPSSSVNYINGTLNGVSGAYAHTQSYWVNGVDGTSRAAFTVGTNIAGAGVYANLYWDTTNGPGGRWTLNTDSAASATWVQPIEDNRWYHVVLTYDGGSSTSSWKFYLDGEYQTPTTMSVSYALALPSNPEYRIGRNDGTQWYNGMVSSPKVWSVVLEPSEVKKLYNLGRTGRSMVISDTAVGIGKAPEAQLDVRGSVGVAGYLGIGVNPGDSLGGSLHVATRHGDAIANANRRYFRYDVALTAAAGGVRGSVYGRWDIISSAYFISTAGTVSASDERIKKNIIDVNDSSALTTLRLLKPKRYEYRDTVERGTEPVWGFIAQEVRDTLPYATQLRTDYVPNIYQLANVTDSNVITFSEFNTSELEDSKILKVISSNDEEHEVRITEIIDDNTIRVNTGLDAWTGSVDDDGNIVSGNQIFVYGQKIDDFIFVKKDAIWTIATAALQEVDRQLQAERARNDALEARIETNTRELQNENNRLKNKVAILENRQTHYNTLLVNLTGRIETLERGA